ncbi:hypothetical protein EX30DRAFT_391988 [Ascodesmis nigricans]|uniref:Uncharacterized protein n=1 Tax=Ascodesmis nigricans TaxID=341454 RepID=A0A4V3SJL8_9PEZI|nr:hypothetical protein EX30DRAFT_391988 [Ascodesmis nigricans]
MAKSETEALRAKIYANLLGPGFSFGSLKRNPTRSKPGQQKRPKLALLVSLPTSSPITTNRRRWSKDGLGATRTRTRKSTIDLDEPLESQKKEGPIKNIGMIIGEMCGLADTWGDMVGEEEEATGWKKHLLKIAHKRSIKVMCCKRKLEEYDADISQDEENESEGGDMDIDDEWEDEDSGWGFIPLFVDYKNGYPSRGKSTMDLSKLTKAQRDKYSRSPSF